MHSTHNYQFKLYDTGLDLRVGPIWAPGLQPTQNPSFFISHSINAQDSCTRIRNYESMT